MTTPHLNSKIDNMATQLVASGCVDHSAENRIFPPIVKEPGKLYDIKRLGVYGDADFVIKRMETQDVLLSYRNAIDAIKLVLQGLRQNQIPNSTGVALRFAHHTPSTCILILAILNHECHFFATDKLMVSKELKQCLCRAGIEFLIASGHMAVGAAYFDCIDSFVICNEEYKLFKVRHHTDDDQPEATKALPPNMCYTISTTGTTGAPKLVHVPYECIAPNILGLSQKLKVSMADIIYMGTPCTFDPFVVELFLALHNGAAVLISQHSMRESPSKLLNALFPTSVSPPGITILQMTPSLFRHFGGTAIRERILNTTSTLRVLLLGGEPFPSKEELSNWMDPCVLQHKMICNIYGITEMSCWTLMHILQSLRTYIPLGKPIDDETLLRFEKKQNNEVRDLPVGELVLGSSTRRCYIPQVDDRKQQNTDGLCYRATGDYVRLMEDMSICYEERTNEIVKRAGNRIHLGQIARKIQRYLPSHELATCLWQEELQKLICCIRIIQPKTKLEQRAESFDILSKLMAVEQPDRFIYVQNFPFNSHGKLDRTLLLKDCKALAHAGQDILKHFLRDTLKCLDMKPGTSKKLKLDAQVEPTELMAPGYDLSFRQAGGTSFHAVTLSREIGMQMCIDDEQRHLFEMLLNELVPLTEVLDYLDKVKMVAHNPKMKPIEQSLCGNSSIKNLVAVPIQKPSIQVKVHWQANFHKCVDSPVAQWQGRYVSVGAHSKQLCTHDAETGKLISSITLPDRIECKVTFVDETYAVVGCHDGCLYGFQPLTGAFLWCVEVGGIIKAQPLLSSDKSCIVVCSYAKDYNIMCICAKQQSILWCIRVGEKSICATPLELPREKSFIVCTLDGTYARVALETGEIEWMQKFKDPLFSSPVLLDSGTKTKIFLCAEVSGNLHACDCATGKVLGSYTAEGSIFSSFLLKVPPTNLGHTFVIFGCIDKHIYSLRCRTRIGEPVEFEIHWKVNISAPVYSTPILLSLQPNIYLVFGCTTDGCIVILNLTDGQLVYSYKLMGEVFSTPCYIDHIRRIYVGCRDNHLYCIGI